MNRLSIYLLLFADDLALFTTHKHSLQAQLDIIHFIRLVGDNGTWFKQSPLGNTRPREMD